MNPLLDIISRPEKIPDLSLKEWDTIIRFARHAKLLGYLQLLVERNEFTGQVPEKVQGILEGARVNNSFYRLLAKHELRHIAKLFRDKNIPLVLLKGAAYIEAQLSPYSGRRLSDVDLLVAESDMQAAEKIFQHAGWVHQEENEYDQHYYRAWMHEIPPLVYPERGVEIDMHHNLVPPVSRIKPDARTLMAKAVPIENSFFLMLEPKDMFLHSATHLFFNDELRGGLRDLVDMHELSAQFSVREDFWPELVERARELQMERPLYYALTALQRMLHTNIPEAVMMDISHDRPMVIIDVLMRNFINRLIAPKNVEHMQAPITQWLLFVRSHWVRMPPLMLIKHLSHKAWGNTAKTSPES